ncbi:CRISPR-associated helicase Cas3' [Scopulibacillus darangshiensis]|uniref:CRISPR-associated helicase Cas3' n=1 Tax=Scopulibacillus darangshiensis TaxID=442528 RepID=UPI001FB1E33B|nr:CRISPR-associated helicase Cas3' [Scopulibacillus darangshiensis]
MGEISDYIAHIRQSDGKIQSVHEHLIGVKGLAARFGSKIEVEHIAGLAGLLHDLGKYSEGFRSYILEAVGNPDHPPKKGSVDHSTAGGKLLYDEFHLNNHSVPERMIAEMVGNVIISHHMGLQDFLTSDMESDYLKRVREKRIEDFLEVKKAFYQTSVSKEDLKDYISKSENEFVAFLKQNITGSRMDKLQLTLMFLTKYIFSCLIDADRTDTRCFEEGTFPCVTTESRKLFEGYYKKLTEYLNKINEDGHSKTAINILREKMSKECDDFAQYPSGIYTLSIPTGGGKTLASLRYALKHAIKHKKDRIIYVVPYTTIIEQNAEDVKRILNDHENIIEHHSNVIEHDDYDNNRYGRDKALKLAKDNWDAPIIFTTMVQFLNTFYSSGTRNVRRLHNLSHAVIVFDEVQSVPIKCISLFNEALNFLKNVCHSSILLCTATQPALDFVEKSIDSIDGEIIQDLDQVVDAFKRVEIIDKTSNHGWNTEDLSRFVFEQVNDLSNVLVILNTKTVVRKLFNQLKENNPDLLIYHLSTSMCAAHRKDILSDVREALDKGERVVCLSTQLIEAGVDVSFNCVVRSLAGLDSIAQAAGRCNRHGEHAIRNVYIINHNEENLDYLKTIKIGAGITHKILLDRKSGHGINDILSPKALELYFQNYYHELKSELDYHVPALKNTLYELLNSNEIYKCGYKHKTGKPFPLLLHTSIKTAAKYFNVIDNNTTSLLVPYKEGADIIAEFNEDLSIQDFSVLLKQSQQYTVNIYERELNELSKNNNIVYLRDGKILVLRENAYDLDFGVNIEGDGKMETHFI